MATHSNILAWKIPWTEEPGVGHSPRSHKVSDMTEQLHFTHFIIFTGEGHGNSLQYSCLEIPWMEEPGQWWSMGSQRVRHN